MELLCVLVRIEEKTAMLTSEIPVLDLLIPRQSYLAVKLPFPCRSTCIELASSI